MVWVPYRNDEPKFAAPISTHCPLCRTASTYRLVGAVDIGGNLNQVGKPAGNVPN